MKKYEAPVTEIVEIEAADVITTSGTGSETKVPATKLPGTAYDYDQNGNATGLHNKG